MDRNIRYQVLKEERDDDEIPEEEEEEEDIQQSSNPNNHGSSSDLRPLLSSYIQTASEVGPPPLPDGVLSSNAVVPPPDDTLIPPPAYEEINMEEGGQSPQQQLQAGAMGSSSGAHLHHHDLKANQMTLGDACTAGLPPSYAVATDLPSYEEAERLKREEEEEGGVPPGGGCRVHPHHHHHHHHLRAGLTDEDHIHLEDGPVDPSQGGSDRPGSGMTVGTDWIFFCTFVMSFLFNWLGFLMSLCITNTVAGRCGALAGLGLSMVKWVAIVKHSGFAGDLAAGGESWFWWILMLCGFLLFIRGCMQYVNVKYEWKRITGRLHHFYLF